VKDELLKRIAGQSGYNRQLNMAREYLQAYILRCLYLHDFFKQTAFHGGTCLRFLYQTRRFSEDLDFALLDKQQKLDLELMIVGLVTDLEDSGYKVSVKIKGDMVRSALIQFSDLLYEAGISQRAEENLSIKIDMDTNPPNGARFQNQIIHKHFMFGITAYDLSSLFTGKINAILTRNYLKGRDYYDLFWYLATYKGLLPNLDFLNHSLHQFNPGLKDMDAFSWKGILAEKVHQADWKTIFQDVNLLLEDTAEQAVFTKENLLLLLH
jgi:predicted nucleotidyltransferase component of viral defense system